MKILLITMEWPPFKGGVGNYYFNLVNNLDGLEVEVFNAGPPSFYRFFRPRWLKLFFQIKKSVKNNRPDLIWVGQVLPAGAVALLIKKFFKIPYFVSVHGMDILLPQKSARKEKVLKSVLRVALFITANSQFTKKELLNLQIEESKIEVVYPCPNLVADGIADNVKIGEIKNKLNLGGKRILLTVGRLVQRKGHGKVIEALPALLKRFPGLVYLIIGRGAESSKLKTQSLKLGVADKVIFLDHVGDAELPAYYGLADVFVMPSVDLAGDVEGFGTVYLEAALFGLPSVAFSIGGVSEAIIDGRTGLLAEPGSQQDLVSKIADLLSNAPFADSLGENGRQRAVTDFNWQKQALVLLRRIKKDLAFG